MSVRGSNLQSFTHYVCQLIVQTRKIHIFSIVSYLCKFVLVREAEAILDANTVGPKKYIESYKKYNNILSSQVIFIILRNNLLI